MKNWEKLVERSLDSSGQVCMEFKKYSKLVKEGKSSLLENSDKMTEVYKNRDKIWEHYQKGKVEKGPMKGVPYYIGLHYMKWYVLMKRNMFESLEQIKDKDTVKGCLVSAGVSYDSGHEEIEKVLESSGILEWGSVGNVAKVHKPGSVLYVTESTDIAIESIQESVKSLVERGVPENMVKVVKWDLVNHSPFRSKSFDFIFSALVTCYFTKEEQIAIWKEFYRILAKEGLLIQSMITTNRGDRVFIPTKNTGNPFVKLFTLLTAPALWPIRIPGTKVGALGGYISWMSSGYAEMSEEALREGWFEYLSPEVLMEIAEDVGFTENGFERNSEFWEKSIPIVITVNKK